MDADEEGAGGACTLQELAWEIDVHARGRGGRRERELEREGVAALQGRSGKGRLGLQGTLYRERFDGTSVHHESWLRGCFGCLSYRGERRQREMSLDRSLLARAEWAGWATGVRWNG
jgi:hypothetical protein